MYDIFTTLLLVDHFARRNRPIDRKQAQIPEPELPWGRIFAWHRGTDQQ